MSIIRGPRPETKFYQLDKTISEDVRLSWAARGLLIFLLGKPDHWQVNTKHLVEQTAGAIGRSSGREGVLNLLQELKTAGYVRTRQVRKQGRFVGLDYLVSEQPTLATDWEDGDEPTEDGNSGAGSTAIGLADSGLAGSGKPGPLVKKEEEAKKELKAKNQPTQKTRARKNGGSASQPGELPEGHTYLPPDFKPSQKHADLAARYGLDLEQQWLAFEQKCVDEKWHSAAWDKKFNTWLGNAKVFAEERAKRAANVRPTPHRAPAPRNPGLVGGSTGGQIDYSEGIGDDGSF